jgi:predicted nucleotidyltransferase
VTTVTLTGTSGDSRADAVLSDVVESLRRAIGPDLRGLYLAGSYADRSAVPLSDLDLIAVLREGSDERLAERVAEECAQRSAIRLDLAAVTTRAIVERFVALVPAFRLGTVLVWGADVREEVPLPTIDAFAAAWADRARRFMLRIRRLDAAEGPFGYPDPEGEFFGYDRATVSTWYPPGTTQSTKELVAIVGGAATALVARVGGAYVTTKAECVQLYADRVGDEWTDLVLGIHHLCRTRLNYGLPTSKAERSELRELCAKVLPFENHVLGEFARGGG